MNDEIARIFITSLKVSSLSTIIVMALALALGLAMHRWRHWGLKALEIAIYVPMAMPPVAVGYGLLMILGPHSAIGTVLGSFNLSLAFNFAGAVVAAVMASLGIGLRTVRLGLDNLDPHYLEQPQILGASYWQQFYHIIWPLIKPSLWGGAILVFIRSLGEFGATIVLAGNNLETRTLALGIWTELQKPGGDSQALILVMLSALVSLFALVAVELVGKRK